MRLTIATTTEPFVQGGAIAIVESTAHQLELRGHSVEVVTLPFSYSLDDLLRQLASLRGARIGMQAERLITVRWPAHVLQHRDKACWFLHHHRHLTDLWNTPLGYSPASHELALGLRRIVMRADSLALSESQSVFVNSKVVQRRVKDMSGVGSEVLYPPLPVDPALYRNEGHGDYVVYPSRVNGVKRQHLAIEALAHCRSPVRLVIVGASDETGYADHLRQLASSLGLTGRVDFRDSWISEEEKSAIIARSCGVLYFPFEEDSYGYASLEASHSEKPIITTEDSGGVLEFVINESNGFVCKPEPSSIAMAMDKIHQDPSAAATLGANCADRRHRLHVSWDHVCSRLTNRSSQ